MILLVQDFLRTQTFLALEQIHGVEMSVDRRFGHKFSLNYNQITSTDSDPLAQQCRGLILSNGSSLLENSKMIDGRANFSHICPGSTKILAYPMDRFFNYGQGSCAPINWNDSELKTFEKLDGTLCIVYFDSIINEWHVATRSVPEADIPLLNPEYTFRTLFERGLKNVGNVSFFEFVRGLDPEKTYCYELTSPWNRVVVRYDDTKITLLAVRNNVTKLESLPEKEGGSFVYVPVVQYYDLGTIEKVVDFVNLQNPMDHEGIVLRDSKYNRIKVKNASYVAYSKARDSLAKSPRACLELVINEKADDVMPYMPNEIAENLKKIQLALANYLRTYDLSYQLLDMTVQNRRLTDPSVMGWSDQRLFAICTEEMDIWKGPCFAIRSGKAKNALDYIHKSKKLGSYTNGFLDNLLKLIGCYT